MSLSDPTHLDDDKPNHLADARRRLFNSLCVVIAALGMLSGVATGVLTIDRAPIATVIAAIGPSLALLLVPIARKTSRYGACSVALLTFFYCIIIYIILAKGGGFSLTLVYLAALPLFAALLLGDRETVIASVVMLATYVLFAPLFADPWIAVPLAVLGVGAGASAGSFRREMSVAMEALHAARERAEAGERAKASFLANMSHELRTPLNSVLGMAQLLQKEELTGRQEEYAGIIISAGRSLLGVINDILDLSRIDSDAAPLVEDVFDVEWIASDICDSVRGVAAEKELSIAFEVSPEAAGRYIGDEQKIRQVLTNFIGNAVKFTEKGSVTLEVAKVDKGGLRFSVIDTGPGISPADQAKVFDRFKQADGSSTRAKGGAGLGLAISAALAELMKGAVGLTSEEGQGSVFWFEVDLPRAPAAEAKIEAPITAAPKLAAPKFVAPKSVAPKSVAAAAGALEPAASASGACKRVLLAEDDAANQMLISAVASSLDASLDIFDDGRAALEALKADDGYDLAIVDMQMPVVSGEQVIAAIRSGHAARQDMPIIAVTASADSETIDRVKQLGADRYLTKPLQVDGLRALMQQVMTQREAA